MAPRNSKSANREISAHDYGRLMRWLLIVLSLVSVSGAAVAVARFIDDPNNLPFRYVRLTGELVHLDRENLQGLVTDSIDGGFFTLDLDAIGNKVRAMPWVEQVRLKRIWPETLLLDVVEQKPVARWGQSSLVTASGLVFEPDEKQLANYPVKLHGPDGMAYRVVSFFLLHEPEFLSVDLNLQSIIMDARRDWHLEFKDGMKLVMSDEEGVDKLQRFIDLYPRLAMQAKEGRVMKTVDLRYQHGLAVGWENIPPGADIASEGEV